MHAIDTMSYLKLVPFFALEPYHTLISLVHRNGSNVQGYFVWSFLDVFEYLFGYRMRFGVCGVEFNSAARTRYQRHSAKWYSSFLRGGELRPVALPEGAYSQ